MKNRAPRKKKKKAKKLKAANDASVMVRTALITASGYAQIAIIRSKPFGLPALKAVTVAQTLMETAKAISTNMSEIKHWTNFVPNYRIR